MEKFQVWAQPWWVNLLVFVPLIVWFLWRREGLRLSWRQLTILAAFAAAFGFSEAAVVVYLRAAAGLLPGSPVTLAHSPTCNGPPLFPCRHNPSASFARVC